MAAAAAGLAWVGVVTRSFDCAQDDVSTLTADKVFVSSREIIGQMAGTHRAVLSRVTNSTCG